MSNKITPAALAAFNNNKKEQHLDDQSLDIDKYLDLSASISQEEGDDGASVMEDTSAHFDSVHNPGGGASSTRSGNSADNKATISKELHTTGESQKVFRLRLLVILVLILTALAVSSVVFKITVQGEVDEFETQYEGASNKVIESFEAIMEKMGSVAGLGVSYTSQGKHASPGSAWPFVTLDDFPPRARNVLQLSGALMVGMSPVLPGAEFDAWDDYVQEPENYLWINASIAYQNKMGLGDLEPQATIDALTIDNNRVVDVMHYFGEGTVVPEVPGSDWYLPIWQTTPYVREGLVNNNLLRYENTTNVVRKVLESGSAVLGGYYAPPPGTMDSENADTALLATLQSAQAGTPMEYRGDPMTNFYIPIFDGFALKRKVVGVLNAVIHWQSYLRKVLPQNVQGIVVVLEYQCGGDDAVPTTKEDARRRAIVKEAPKSTTAASEPEDQNERELATFTIIYDDEETLTPTDADKTPAPTSADTNAPATTTNSYWNVNPSTEPPAEAAAATAPSDAGNSYWNVPTDPPTSISATNSYWNVNPPPTSDEPSTAPPVNSYWAVDNPTTASPISSYWSTDPPTTARPTASATTTPPLATASEESKAQNSTATAEQGNNNNNNNNTITEEEGVNLDANAPEEGGSYFTYIIQGTEAHVLGKGDLHDPTFDEYMRMGSFAAQSLDDGTLSGIPIDQQCTYNLYVYPSQDFFDEYITSTPLIITLVIVAVFIFAIVMFLVYNRLVERRQRRILKKATESTAIVSSLFPKNVRDRLLQGGGPDKAGSRFDLGAKSRLKGFMAGEHNENDSEAAPIADLFPFCTVFFADIAGFTAWSSTREPSQVFILLQNVYQAFDTLAKRRRVFKVETIGDSYMAVTGLPDPQDSHASIMVRFAWDCLVKMKEVTKNLESSLGPDTTELSMRIGLHSGPVTAGVLRGDRARFQLFGDTVNTASRMESTGIRGKIQVSEATANILKEHGRDHWLVARSDPVKAKGKGLLKTYWANPKNRHNSNSGSWDTGSSEQASEEDDKSDAATDILHQAQIRLVDWIVKLMSDDIRKVIFARNKSILRRSRDAPTYNPPEGTTCMDEVKEVIHMPKFDAQKAHGDDYKHIDIDPAVIRELGQYVTGIAKMYRNNPFHNFEHACHVTMSVNKLIRRIVSPELSSEQVDGFDHASGNKLAMHLHDYTYGINSDPLAMFAMTFSALIHDVDHRGVSNMQLAVEAPDMATKYHKKSIAEQNSLDLAWEYLMKDQFSTLRQCLFETEEELLRFRQLIVNIVLATDIFDKELNDLRKNRWKRAFSGEEVNDTEATIGDMKATIVIEHIIQASDVSHTMQHWHVYRKWNKCLFREMYSAFKAGRLGKDPASFWYKGEIGFFDNYIIPLAKKLKDCGVFGVSSDEYLNYAVQNRAEWEERGQDIVAALVEEVTAGAAPPAANNKNSITGRPTKKRLSGSSSRHTSGIMRTSSAREVDSRN